MAWSPWMHKAYAAYENEEKRRRARVAGGGYSAEAAALFTRFTTPPTSDRKVLINNLVVALKAAGVWTKLDALYVMAAADSQAARQNWIADQYNLTAISAPTFTADIGFTGDGSASYLDTGADRSLLSKYTQNSASLATWESLAISADNFAVSDASGAAARISGRSNGGVLAGRINDGVSIGPFVPFLSVPTSIGLSVVDRSGASARSIFRDGALLGSDAQASVGLTAGNFWFLRAGAIYAPRRVSAGFIGASLTSGEHASAYAAILTYLQAVGAA